MTTVRRTASALLLAVALCACSSEPEAESSPLASESPAVDCATDGTTDLPVECVPGDRGFDASPAPVDTSGAPASSADIPAVALPRDPEDLALGGNADDPSRTTQTLTVTVPAGARLSATTACRGFVELELTTVPVSKVESVLPCGQDEAIELTVLDPVLLEAPVTYEVTVTAPAPSRWSVALGAVTRPAPAS